MVDLGKREPEGVVLEAADQLACAPRDTRHPVAETVGLLTRAGARDGRHGAGAPLKFHTVTSGPRKARKVWFS